MTIQQGRSSKYRLENKKTDKLCTQRKINWIIKNNLRKIMINILKEYDLYANLYIWEK